MLGLTCQQVACNLSVHSSTVWRTVKRFEEEGSIDERKNEGPHKLTELSMIYGKEEPEYDGEADHA